MRTFDLIGTAAIALAVMGIGVSAPAHAGQAKAAGTVGAFWAIPKEDGKLTMVIAGQTDPVTVNVSSTTVFAGICLDCNLPLEFKPSEAAKRCMVCGCVVSNAACIVGKAVKEGTWQAMIKGLPHGVVLRPTYTETDKPESGIKKLLVDLRAVLIPVSGLESQTPDQVLALVKPFGATSAELIDGGTRLSFKLKSDWTFDREAKLEKALAKLNAKLIVAEEPKPAQ